MTIPWTDETVATLRHLWDEGHTATAIGRMMGTTRNAVLGKIYRLDTPLRHYKSPVVRVLGGLCRRGHVLSEENRIKGHKYVACKACQNEMARLRRSRRAVAR